MKILTCDDHAVFRAGLRTILGELDVELVESSSCDEALRIVGESDIDIVLLDLHMPGTDGWSGLRRMREKHAATPVVIVSASEDPHEVRAALEGGASGFIPKSSQPDVLRNALRLVISGSTYIPPAALPILGQASPQGREHDSRERVRERAGGLTERQLEVLNLVSRGLTNKEIANVLEIREGTVKAHASAIFEALEVTNRTEATLVMKELNLEMPGDD